MQEIRSIRIRKEALKFASSHMTVFPDGSKEALHGHQYVPTVELRYTADLMVPFSEVKSAMRVISVKWDEKVLLAAKNSHFKILKQDQKSIHFILCKKEYQIPLDEVELLPITNVTCEELAQLYSKLFAEEFLRQSNILKKCHSFAIEIEESPGQSAKVETFV